MMNILGEENVFTTFIQTIAGETEPIYLPIDNFDHLKKVLTNKLEEYNETKA